MEFDNSLPCSQEQSAGPWHEPEQSIQYYGILSEIYL
jgi:hypothetical protein